MVICKKCGKPLILSRGKCIYCETEDQGEQLVTMKEQENVQNRPPLDESNELVTKDRTKRAVLVNILSWFWLLLSVLGFVCTDYIYYIIILFLSIVTGMRMSESYQKHTWDPVWKLVFGLTFPIVYFIEIHFMPQGWFLIALLIISFITYIIIMSLNDNE